MTQYEILKINRTLFELIESSGISVRDVRYIEIYERYCVMRSQGDKVGYIVNKLADTYRLTPRYIEKIVNRMKNEINI